MAGTLTTSSAEAVIAQCEAGIYGQHHGSEPLDLLAMGIIETYIGSLEKAKDLLSQAQRRLDGKWKAKAGVQLAVAYYRAGEKMEAAAILETLPLGFDQLLMRAVLESESEPERAIDTLRTAEEYDVSRYNWGRFHNLRGMCFRRLGEYERARREYDAALYFLRGCPLEAMVRNNLGAALVNSEDAHASIDSAIETLHGPHLAQAYDLKARTFLKEGKLDRAEEYASFAIGLLEQTDNRAWLAETLFTYADALIAGEKHDKALIHLSKIWEIGEYLDDRDLKFKAAQAIYLTAKHLQKTYHMRSVKLAIDGAWSLNSAARKLGTSRQALKEFMQTHRLGGAFRRPKTIITKQ